MKKNPDVRITFSSDAFPMIRKILGYKNLKCKFCGKRITKRNIGGIIRPHVVMCKNSCCIVEAIHKNEL